MSPTLYTKPRIQESGVLVPNMGNEGGCLSVGAPVAFDRIADALGDQARRQVLVELVDHNPLDYREAVTGNGEGDHADGDLQMVHTHLPKLDDMGYISWNSDAGTVVKGANWEEIEPVIRLFNDHSEQLPSVVF